MYVSDFILIHFFSSLTSTGLLFLPAIFPPVRCSDFLSFVFHHFISYFPNECFLFLVILFLLSTLYVCVAVLLRRRENMVVVFLESGFILLNIKICICKHFLSNVITLFCLLKWHFKCI